jgi:hypothetical protein
MARVLAAALVIGAIAAPPPAQATRPNLTGTWRLDARKSNFGGSQAPESIVQVIDHQEPAITITTTTAWRKDQAGVSEQTLTTDGKESVNKMEAMGVLQDVKVTGAWRGDTLAIAWKIESPGGPVEFNDSWSLSADRKVLTLVRAGKTSQGAFTLKTVYTKQ